MKFRIGLIIMAGLVSLMAGTASATTIKIGTTTMFAADYEMQASSNAAFPDATGDYDPAATLVGTWGTTTEETTGGFNGMGGTQVQVTGLKGAGAPGPFQGDNYLRVVRGTATPANVFSHQGIVAANSVAGTPVHFETMLWIAPFANGSTTTVTRVMALFDTDSNPLVNIEIAADGTIYNRHTTPGGFNAVRTDTGLDVQFGQWKQIAVDYAVGASTWGLTYDGTTITGLVAYTGNNGKLGSANIGGGNAALPAGTALYFDAVPEPGSIAIMCIGTFGLCLAHKFRRSAC